MPTLEDVNNQIKGLSGLQKYLGRKEIKELPNILWPDEKIENLVQGTYANGNGILVATTKRLVFVNKGLMFGLKVEDFPYEKISSVQYETGLVFGKLTIFASGNKAMIENMDKASTRTFGDWLRSRITKKEEPIQQANAGDDKITQLERLGKLKEQGILTESEFNAQKKAILGS